MIQRGNAGKDLVQIGRDYFKYIQVNILSGSWGSVTIALIPLLFFLYGVKATGDTVAEVVETKQPPSKLPPDRSLVQAKDIEIGKLKKRVEDYVQRLNEISAKDQTRVEALQKSLNDRQTELDNQKNLVQQKEQKVQTLEARINNLNTQLEALVVNGQQPPEQSGIDTPVQQADITKSEYDTIQNGMTYEQVAKIVGSPGQNDGTNGPFTFYKWDDGSYFGVRMTFTDGKLNSKSSYNH